MQLLELHESTVEIVLAGQLERVSARARTHTHMPTHKYMRMAMSGALRPPHMRKMHGEKTSSVWPFAIIDGSCFCCYFMFACLLVFVPEAVCCMDAP